MSTLMRDADNLPRKLLSGPYAERALAPASPWLDSIAPLTPVVRTGWDAARQTATLSLDPKGSEATWLWVIRARVGDNWTTDIVPGQQRFYVMPRLPGGAYADAVSVSSVDRTGNESTATLLDLPTHQ
jgi:hypothetical protein